MLSSAGGLCPTPPSLTPSLMFSDMRHVGQDVSCSSHERRQELHAQGCMRKITTHTSAQNVCMCGVYTVYICVCCRWPTYEKGVHRAASVLRSSSPSRLHSHHYWQQAHLGLLLQICRTTHGRRANTSNPKQKLDRKPVSIRVAK